MDTLKKKKKKKFIVSINVEPVLCQHGFHSALVAGQTKSSQLNYQQTFKQHGNERPCVHPECSVFTCSYEPVAQFGHLQRFPSNFGDNWGGFERVLLQNQAACERRLYRRASPHGALLGIFLFLGGCARLC